MKMSVHKEYTNELLPLEKDKGYFNKIQVFLLSQSKFGKKKTNIRYDKKTTEKQL